MASAQFQIQVDGGGYGTAGVQATASGASVINCRLSSTEGVKSVAWSFHGTHASAATIPTITLSGTPNGQIATFTLPAGVGQAYGIQCDVNGGAEVTQDNDTTSKSAVRVAFSNGNLPVFVSETFEEDATHSTVPKFNALLASIDGGPSVNSEASVNITTDTNNLDPGTATTLLVTLTNNWNLTGIAAPGDGDSYRLVVINDDTQDILVLKHQDGSSLAANRFNLSNSVDIYLKPGDRATLTYNTTSGYWEQESLASLALRMVEVSPAALAAQQNNWDPSSGAYYNTVRVLLTGAQTLTGLVSPATSTGTREEVLICNIDATDVLTIAHQSTASTSANRIICPRGVSFQVQPGGSVLARYIIAANRWQLVAPDSAATLPYRFAQLETDTAASTSYDFDFDLSLSGPWGGPHEDDAVMSVVFHVAYFSDTDATYSASSKVYATYTFASGVLYINGTTQEVPDLFTEVVTASGDNARISITTESFGNGRLGVFAEVTQIVVNA